MGLNFGLNRQISINTSDNRKSLLTMKIQLQWLIIVKQTIQAGICFETPLVRKNLHFVIDGNYWLYEREPERN